jgi:hypothetical protein
MQTIPKTVPQTVVINTLFFCNTITSLPFFLSINVREQLYLKEKEGSVKKVKAFQSCLFLRKKGLFFSSLKLIIADKFFSGGTDTFWTGRFDATRNIRG